MDNGLMVVTLGQTSLLSLLIDRGYAHIDFAFFDEDLGVGALGLAQTSIQYVQGMAVVL